MNKEQLIIEVPASLHAVWKFVIDGFKNNKTTTIQKQLRKVRTGSGLLGVRAAKAGTSGAPESGPTEWGCVDHIKVVLLWIDVLACNKKVIFPAIL